MEKVKFKDITINMDNRRKPLNSIDREKISTKKLYPYCGANAIMDYVDEYIFDEEILCIAEDGGKWGKNEECSYIMKEKCWVNNHAHVIKGTDKVDIRYLKYWLNYNDLNSLITGAIVKKLTQKALNELEIIIPEKNEQLYVCNILDKVQEIIDIRKKQVEGLDKLIKSQFVEMFGKIENRVKIKDCCIKITDYVASGSFASIRENVKHYDMPEYAIMVRTTDFANNFSRNLTYTDKKGYKFLHNSNLFGGELLLSNIGASIGKVHRVPYLKVPMTLAPNAIMLKTNDKYLEDYLQYYFFSDEGQIQLKSMTTATAMPKFNKTQLKEIEIIDAPINLQKRFSNIVQQIDKKRIKIQKSLEEIQKLQESLMNEYFS